MGRLAEEVREAKAAPGTAVLWWLGQAGFVLKSSGGTVVFVDPYLSDAARRLHGFRRLSLPPMDPDEVRADLVVLTHEHTDHLDPDTLPVIASKNPACLFAAPSSCGGGLDAAGVVPKRRLLLSPGAKQAFRDMTVHAAGADHGALAPLAISIALDLGGVKMMMSGDSSWRSDLFKPLFDLGLDVVMPCINGGFGNMGHVDAARMVGESGARIAIPCHFWTFAEQGAGDPMGFVTACQQLAPGARPAPLPRGGTDGDGRRVKTRHENEGIMTGAGRFLLAYFERLV
jgi:L-ascorbate 6-phosphate lactonase